MMSGSHDATDDAKRAGLQAQVDADHGDDETSEKDADYHARAGEMGIDEDEPDGEIAPPE